MTTLGSNPYQPTDKPRLVGHLWAVGYLDTGWADLNASVRVVWPADASLENVREATSWYRAAVVHESTYAHGDLVRLAIKQCDRFAEAIGWPISDVFRP